MEHLERSIAEGLLSIRAVFFRPNEPFTWASGIKSPVYCDNRLILTAPEVRTQVESALCKIIRADYPDVEVLMGTSTAGIAHAAIVGHMMGLPMGYVRSSGKDHGRQNQIEGRLEPGQKVVVIEDLISTGGSVIEVVEALRDGVEALRRMQPAPDERRRKRLPEQSAAFPSPVRPTQKELPRRFHPRRRSNTTQEFPLCLNLRS